MVRLIIRSQIWQSRSEQISHDKINHYLKILRTLYKKCVRCDCIVEEFHRELKQLTGIESCQCRKGRIQRNHIACAILVWLKIKDLAYKSGQTIYQIKHGLLSNYLVQQLKRPNIPMFAARRDYAVLLLVTVA